MNALYRRGATLFLAVTIICAAGCSAAQEDAGSGVIGFYGAPDGGSAPLEVHFHPTGEEALINSITKWAWDFGDGGSSSENYTSHEYTADGVYTVTLTVTLPGGKTHNTVRRDYIRIAAGEEPSEEEEAPVEHEVGEAEEQESVEPVQCEVDDESGGDAPVAGSGKGAVFIHHSCGENWLNSGLHRALLAKPYIDDRNDITYGTELNPDPGRPGSLGSTAGDLTDMHHWILWFNDYLQRVRAHGGGNRIILFKSCFPNSHVDDPGSEPGEPFGDWRAIANYKAIFRHPAGAGKVYQHDGHAYRALQDVFAKHPDILFIPVTAPPECRQETDKAIAANARAFNNWLKNEWLPAYTRATGLHNVAVFDWFDILAEAPGSSAHANMLRSDYGGNSGDSHPNAAANARSTQLFATFLDEAWQAFEK